MNNSVVTFFLFWAECVVIWIFIREAINWGRGGGHSYIRVTYTCHQAPQTWGSFGDRSNQKNRGSFSNRSKIMGSFSESSKNVGLSVISLWAIFWRTLLLNFLQTKDLWNIRHQVDHRLWVLGDKIRNWGSLDDKSEIWGLWVTEDRGSMVGNA